MPRKATKVENSLHQSPSIIDSKKKAKEKPDTDMEVAAAIENTNPKRNANDTSIEGITYSTSTKRFKSFLATYPDPETGKMVRRRITFERTITNIVDAREEKARLLASLDAVTRVSIERLKFLESLKKWDEALSAFYKHRLEIDKVDKNTADSNKSNLKNWVFRYFLVEISEYNTKNWPLKFNDFKVWLAHEKSDRNNTKSDDGSLTVNTQNNAIRALNAWIAYQESKTGEPQLRCEVNDSPNIKGAENVIVDSELTRLFQFLKDREQDAFEFAYVLRHTGMRVKEAQALGFMSCNFEGLNDKKTFIHEKLKSAGFQIFGRIDLAYQLVNDTNSNPLNTNYRLEFGPLKHRTEISEKFTRYIPIIDETLAQILARRTQEAFERYEQGGAIGNDVKQFLLFPNITYAGFRNLMELAYSKGENGGGIDATIEKRPHDFRHTFITSLIGAIGGEVTIPFARDIWGHTDYRTISRYEHLYDSMKSTNQKMEALTSKTKINIKAF